MKNNILASFLTLTSLLIVGTGFSYPYEDNAGTSPYDDGWQNSDDSNLGSASFDPWLLLSVVDSSTLAIDATSVGGSPLLNTNGRAWVISTNRANTTESSIYAVRNIGSACMENTIAQIDIQIVNLGKSSSIYFSGNGGTCLILEAASSKGTNWVLSDGGHSEVSIGVPATTPIRIRYIDSPTGTNYTLKIYQLSDGALLYNNSSTTYSSTCVNMVGLSQWDFGVAGTDTYMITNNLIFDTTGTLPVELDFFMVE
jgi:hypothetical protein